MEIYKQMFVVRGGDQYPKQKKWIEINSVDHKHAHQAASLKTHSSG